MTNIGRSAFSGCTGLTNVVVGNKVKDIDDYAFCDCFSLSSVTMFKKNPLPIEQYTFTNLSKVTLNVPFGSKAAYETSYYFSSCKEIIEMPKSIINFADAKVKTLCVANWDTNGDGELDEEEAAEVTDIGTIFSGNTTIKTFDELKYFTGLIAIGDCAFSNCTGLTSVTIPEGVTSIGDGAFENCISLTSVTIPSSVSSIGIGAFWYCIGLTSVIISEGVTSIGRGAFEFCIGLTSVVIPSNLSCIGEEAFHGCSSLSSLTLSEGVTSIGNNAFSNCNNLTSVSIPSSIKNIGNEAFSDCSGLTTISVATGNSKYDSRNNCNAIIETSSNTLIAGCKNTIIPKTVTSIGYVAFSGCSGLISVSIPLSVTSIGSYAFYGCNNLTSVSVEMETPVSIDNESFSNRKNATLYVPSGCISAYKGARYWKEFKEIVEMEPTGVEVTDISQMDNVIYIEPAEGRCGSQTTLSVKMKNDVAIQTIQFDLYLPDGITIVPNEDEELVTVSKERINRFNYFESSMQSDGALRLLAQATSTNVPVGDGEICRIVLDIPENMEEGDYPLVIKGALMVENDNTSHSPDPNLVQTKLTVLDYVPGDANNDGDVNAIDFNMIGNYILGRTQNGFNLKAADISGDGDVNAIDFNMVGNMILNGSTASARERRKPTNMEKDNEPQ